MKFIVSRNTLLHALQHARCVIQTKSESLFRDFVFTFPDDPKEATMTIHASNSEQWITETVPLDQPADAPRSFGVYYGEILPAIKSLDDQPLAFEVAEYQMTVTHSCGSFHIPLSNSAQEFLSLHGPCPDADAPDGCTLEYEAPGLRSVLSRCNFAIAQDELRPVMNGVYVNLTSDYADYVSSDGHKLVQVRKSPVFSDNRPMQVSFIIPYRAVKILLRILPSTGDVVFEYQKELIKERTKTAFDGKKSTYNVVERRAQARIVIDDRVSLSFNPIEGKYPQYWSVIPLRHDFKMLVERRPLVKSLDRLSLFSSESGLTCLNISQDTLRLNASYADLELAAEEQLPCEFSKIDGGHPSPYKIGLKGSSLSEVLKVLGSDKVMFLLGPASRALIVQPVPQPDVEELTMLLMPMLLND